jgi:hypothetical protein
MIGLFSIMGGMLVGLLIWLMQDFHKRLTTTEACGSEKYNEYLIKHAELEERLTLLESFQNEIKGAYLVLRKDICK